ncbi:MAG: response regulator, partial [Bdellovibrionota bacterium]
MNQKTKTVLVVEDSPSLRLFYKQTLKSAGAVVLSFEGAETALEYLQNCKTLPDLILLDLIMPDMTGEEFLFYIRADAMLKDIDVVVCAGKEDLEAHAQNIGADGVLIKPVSAHK